MIWLGAWACGPPPAPPATVAPASCPPEGTPGREPGEIVEDLAFLDCEGVLRSFHGACGGPLLVVNVHGWCGPCLDHVELAGVLQDEHPELQVMLVAAEDALGEPAGAEYCAGLRDAFDVDADVVLDPEQVLEPWGGVGLVLVVDRDGLLTFARNDATEDAIRDAVDAAGR